MPAITVAKTALAYGAGYFYFSNPGVSMPANTVVGSVFTDAWPAGWVCPGVTKDGHEFAVNLDTDDVEAAEYLDPIAVVTTGRSVRVTIEIQQVHATNLKRLLNGGTLTTSGAGTTLLSTYKMPQVGSEVHCQVGWESTDNTERWTAADAFQVGSLTIARKKGADNATFAGAEFRMLPDVNGDPFIYYSAGTIRG